MGSALLHNLSIYGLLEEKIRYLLGTRGRHDLHVLLDILEGPPAPDDWNSTLLITCFCVYQEAGGIPLVVKVVSIFCLSFSISSIQSTY